MGQPLAHNLILKSISSHINTENPSKALVLSLHGSTGTGSFILNEKDSIVKEWNDLKATKDALLENTALRIQNSPDPDLTRIRPGCRLSPENFD